MAEEYLWHDRKRTFLGLPWSFTRYALQEDKLLIDVGFFNRIEDEIRLYHISDVTLRRSFGERLLGLGTIHCCSDDRTSPEFSIRHIKDSRRVKEILSELVEKDRMKHRLVFTGDNLPGDNPPPPPEDDNPHE